MTACYDNYVFEITLFYSIHTSLTVRLEKEKGGVGVCRIYGTGTIGWGNSVLDQQKFYEIKLCDITKEFMIENHKLLLFFLVW